MDNLSPEQIQLMIKMLQSMLGSEQDLNEKTKEDTSQNDNTKFVNNKKIPPRSSNKASTNKFLDMPEMNMHKEDVEVDKKLRTQPPVPRARRFSMVKIVCRVCGKQEEVSPSLIVESPSRYKCNKCSTAAG